MERLNKLLSTTPASKTVIVLVILPQGHENVPRADEVLTFFRCHLLHAAVC